MFRAIDFYDVDVKEKPLTSTAQKKIFKDENVVMF